MALGDYRLCDSCGAKTFYDAGLDMSHVGSLKVLCVECAKKRKEHYVDVAGLAETLNAVGDTTFCLWAVWTVGPNAQANEQAVLEFYVYAETFSEACAIATQYTRLSEMDDDGYKITQIEKLHSFAGVPLLFDMNRFTENKAAD